MAERSQPHRERYTIEVAPNPQAQGPAMKILAVIRQVPDVEEKIRITYSAVDLSTGKLILDTMDEYGVEEALRLRERGLATEVIVLAIGPARTVEALRAALAMGADRAILIEANGHVDVMATSSVVAQVAQQEGVELVFCGGQQADWDSHALGAATAERLQWPQITWTSALTLDGSMLTGTHDVDAGSETVTVALPAVVTTQQGLNDPRYPTLPNIMKARKKELRQETLAAYDTHSRLRLISAAVQQAERRHTILDGKDAPAAAQKLADLLRNEARVIA